MDEHKVNEEFHEFIEQSLPLENSEVKQGSASVMEEIKAQNDEQLQIENENNQKLSQAENIVKDSQEVSSQIEAEKVYDIEKFSGKVFYELREIHKLCQNFYAGRIHAAEQELEKYHELHSGLAFDGILKQVAQIYINNEHLPEKIEDEKTRKRVDYILLDLLQILEEYGVHVHKSNHGDKNSRFVSPAGYIETDDPEQNGKIAESIQTGFYRENSPLMRELVKLYRFTSTKLIGKEEK